MRAKENSTGAVAGSGAGNQAAPAKRGRELRLRGVKYFAWYPGK